MMIKQKLISNDPDDLNNYDPSDVENAFSS